MGYGPLEGRRGHCSDAAEAVEMGKQAGQKKQERLDSDGEEPAVETGGGRREPWQGLDWG